MKLKDLLNTSNKGWSAPPSEKRWSGAYSNNKSGLTEFEQNGGKDFIKEGNMKIGSGKYANLYDIKKEMKEGKFDPENPSIHVMGLGVYNLKLLEKVIKRDLTSRANDLGGELAAKNLNILLYSRYATLGTKIKGLHEVYQQMNSSAYKRAVTIYKKRR